MISSSYIRYFFYLGINWNPLIALRILYHEIRGEKKYKIDTTGYDELNELEDAGVDISHATMYMPADYPLLEELISKVPLINRSHFIDIGCGKGRALCVAAHVGSKRLTGIDFSKSLCNKATKNLAITAQFVLGMQYTIVHNDAFYFEIPRDAGTIFLFNPFDEVILSGLLKNILRSLKENKRSLYIIYLNPLHKEMFLQEGFIEIYYVKRMKYLEASVLSIY